MDEMRADIAVIGGGLGACAAALAAARLGMRVILTEETAWVGGQLTSQAVPPDEHRWIEAFGATASYRTLRDEIRAYYRRHTPLKARARRERFLNPGNGWVSRICFDPRIAVGVLDGLMNAHELSGRLVVLRGWRPVRASTNGDRITSVEVEEVASNRTRHIEAAFYVDGTPWGDLLALAGVEHRDGPEPRGETGEPDAVEHPVPHDEQAVTVVFAMDHLAGEDHTIEKPRTYDAWRELQPPGWPGRLFAWTTVRPETREPLTRHLFDAPDDKPWWQFRRILDATNFEDGFVRSDVTLVNWPHNDHWFGRVASASAEERARSLDGARQLSLSLLYWLQTEAPRADGGVGYPGLRLRADVVGGTPDGLAPAAYVRSARRLVTELTVSQLHIGHPLRPDGPEVFPDSVGIGVYRIDLHPTVGGEGYIDVGCWPFQIPLGALIPVRMENLLPGGKNLGVTHVANGAFRVHPVEWNVGESAGILAAFCVQRKVEPRAVRHQPRLLDEYQSLLVQEGVELAWPSITPV
jgi:hypothetical protein